MSLRQSLLESMLGNARYNSWGGVTGGGERLGAAACAEGGAENCAGARGGARVRAGRWELKVGG